MGTKTAPGVSFTAVDNLPYPQPNQPNRNTRCGMFTPRVVEYVDVVVSLPAHAGVLRFVLVPLGLGFWFGVGGPRMG